MVVTSFLRYRRRVRVGAGLIPISSEKAPKVVGWPPNVMHDSDVYQSLIPYLEAQNADGLVFSLTGERLDVPLAVAAGHKHDTEKTFLRWWPLCNLQPSSDLDPVPEAFSITTDAGYSNTLGGNQVTLPAGASKVVLRGCLSGPSGAGVASAFRVSVTLYGDLDFLFANPIEVSVSWDLGAVLDQAWVECAPVDVSALALSAERQVFCLWAWAFDVSSGAPEVTLYQARLEALP